MADRDCSHDPPGRVCCVELQTRRSRRGCCVAVATRGAPGLAGSFSLVHVEDPVAVVALDPCLVEELSELFLVKPFLCHALLFL